VLRQRDMSELSVFNDPSIRPCLLRALPVTCALLGMGATTWPCMKSKSGADVGSWLGGGACCGGGGCEDGWGAGVED
jgi:hypothetical protein